MHYKLDEIHKNYVYLHLYSRVKYLFFESVTKGISI